MLDKDDLNDNKDNYTKIFHLIKNNKWDDILKLLDSIDYEIDINMRDKTKPVIVREIYDLNDICMFNKCKNISTNVQILLRNEYIMFVRYKVASYGTMTVGFNPANEKLVNKHANYDGEKFDAFYKPADVKYKQ